MYSGKEPKCRQVELQGSLKSESPKSSYPLPPRKKKPSCPAPALPTPCSPCLRLAAGCHQRGLCFLSSGPSWLLFWSRNSAF